MTEPSGRSDFSSKKILQLPSLQKSNRQIDMPRSKKLRHVLPQKVHCRSNPHSPIQQISEQKMHSLQILQLKSFNPQLGIRIILLAQEFPDSRHR